MIAALSESSPRRASASKEAVNLGNCLGRSERLGEAKSLLRKTVPVARRVLGESSDLTLMMRKTYAEALCKDNRATFDDLCKAVRTYEDTERIARRVLGGAHPLTVDIGRGLQYARSALAARDGDNVSAVGEALRKAEV